MSLTQILETITHGLRVGQFQNEQSISQGIILRLLSELGWNVFNTECVCPEYSAGSGRVDFALCVSPRHPYVFIEVKQPGKIDGAELQLFQYAFHQGVPMAVLCDGRSWGFYLPAEAGSYEERRVYKIDLFERTPEEASERLYRYLDFERVRSGAAIADARKDYSDKNRRELTKRTIPEAWKELVVSEQPKIIQELAIAVETKCGVTPEIDDIVSFLKSLLPTHTAPICSSSKDVAPIPASTSIMNMCGYRYKGNWKAHKTAKDVMIGILKDLAIENPSIVERWFSHPDNHGTARTYIARSPQEIYRSAGLEPCAYEFIPGWFVDTNNSSPMKAKIIDMVCRIAGLKKGVDIDYNL